MRRLFLVAYLAALGSAACAPAEPKTFKVTGAVTFEGEPIEEGYIIFHPTAAGDRADASSIVDGEYEFRTTAGVKKVEIRGTRVTDKVGTKGQRIEENYIPAAFNTATKLQAEVTETGPNRFDFLLKARP